MLGKMWTMGVLIVLATATTTQSAISARGMPCVGGYRHGSRVDLPRFWFFCQDGILEPRGCFAANRKRMQLDEAYVYQVTLRGKKGGDVMKSSVAGHRDAV